MAIKRYVNLVLSNYCYREPKRKKDVNGDDDDATSVELSSSSGVYRQQKDSVVSVVLAGGIVKLYSGPITASSVMDKHPGLCLARPQVFSSPYKSIVCPRERLFSGEKFYLVPHSTVMKLQRRAANKTAKAAATTMRPEEGEKAGDGCGEGCRAKDFYVSKENWSQFFSKRFGIKEEAVPPEPPAAEQRDFRRPMTSKMRMYQGLLLGWKPSLRTIKELSP